MRRVSVLLLLALSGVAHADDPAPPVVLHEYVPPPTAENRVVGAAPGTATGRGQPTNPTAIRTSDKILVAPAADQPPAPDEINHGSSEIAADRDTEVRPDYLTQADSTLHYSEVYNPSVVPFKRMSAVDAVRGDYTLIVRDHAREDLPVGGQPSADRDLFWGSLVVNLGGDEVAVPSVAPDMRILSVEAQPPAAVIFSKDSADNYFVRAAGKSAYGSHRLVFLVDAPANYFAPSPPAGISVAEVAALRPLPPLPPRVRDAAAKVLARLRLTDKLAFDDAAGKLVEYFRSFEAGAPPTATGDVYLDLTMSKRGVCRHRAFAFVVTAQALGLSARYVDNEAHAFAELWAPRSGWMRIDLGGSAQELDVANASDKTIYRPRAKDPFPKPRAYSENYTKLKGDVKGLSPEQLAEARAPAGGTGGTGPGGASGDPHSTDPVSYAPGAHLPHPPSVAGSAKRVVALSVESVDREAFRGESVRVGGHARDGAKGVDGLRIDVYFAPAGKHGDGARLVGQTVSGAGGEFSLAVELPLDLGLGKHEVYVATPGTDAIAAAVSE